MSHENEEQRMTEQAAEQSSAKRVRIVWSGEEWSRRLCGSQEERAKAERWLLTMLDGGHPPEAARVGQVYAFPRWWSRHGAAHPPFYKAALVTAGGTFLCSVEEV